MYQEAFKIILTSFGVFLLFFLVLVLSSPILRKMKGRESKEEISDKEEMEESQEVTDKIEQLEKLSKLKEKGDISEEEFLKLKSELLD